MGWPPTRRRPSSTCTQAPAAPAARPSEARRCRCRARSRPACRLAAVDRWSQRRGELPPRRQSIANSRRDNLSCAGPCSNDEDRGSPDASAAMPRRWLRADVCDDYTPASFHARMLREISMKETTSRCRMLLSSLALLFASVGAIAQAPTQAPASATSRLPQRRAAARPVRRPAQQVHHHQGRRDPTGMRAGPRPVAGARLAELAAGSGTTPPPS